MRRLSALLFSLLLIPSLAFAQFIPGPTPLGIASGASVFYPYQINMPNKVVIDNGDGTITLDLISGTMASSYIVNPMTTLGDIIYGGAGGTPSRYGIGAINTVLHANGTPQWSPVVEADISLSNVVTNNATVARHGFLPTISGDPTQFLNGAGNFTTPAGVVNSYMSQAFTSVASVSVVHNFGAKPVVNVLGTGGVEIIPWRVDHDTNNTFSVQFTAATSGIVIATVGSPQPQNVSVVNSDYTAVATDRIIVLNTQGLTVTVPTAIGNTGREYVIKNNTTGTGAVVNAVLAQHIDGATTQTLTADSAINLFSNGVTWLIY